MHKPATESIKTYNPLPDKLFYKIGEVSKIVGVEPYVLRYWETEFPFLKPRKNKSGQRVYIKRDVELLLHIKRLLYQERFTIEGVRKQLDMNTMQLGEQNAGHETQKTAKTSPSQVIEHVKVRLREILDKIQ
jgi:DNA-binding transcriptional MerR regulator